MKILLKFLILFFLVSNTVHAEIGLMGCWTNKVDCMSEHSQNKVAVSLRIEKDGVCSLFTHGTTCISGVNRRPSKCSVTPLDEKTFTVSTLKDSERYLLTVIDVNKVILQPEERLETKPYELHNVKKVKFPDRLLFCDA